MGIQVRQCRHLIPHRDQLCGNLRQCVAEELASRLGRTRGTLLMAAFEQRYDAQEDGQVELC